MSDHQSVQIVPDAMVDNPSLQEEAAAMEQQLGEPQAPQEGQAEQYADERPGWLPEKFESPEALAAAYASLQSEYSRLRNEPEEVGDEEGPIQIAPLSPDDMQPFTDEFEQTGDLSDSSRDAIVQRGIPREMVDRYVEGMQAQTAMEMMTVYNSVGGEDTYNSMIDWASENMDETSIETFNRIVMTGDSNAVMFAVNSVRSQWEAAGNAHRPELLQGDTGYQGASESFQSLAQVTEAMKDPRYKTDPAYRRAVESRLSQSQVL
jgi:hypothetical protein|tara:strand:+ start:1741 stop:2529 length:789 start_codon:yes stop_codon:yes gene_type:complete